MEGRAERYDSPEASKTAEISLRRLESTVIWGIPAKICFRGTIRRIRAKPSSRDHVSDRGGASSSSDVDITKNEENHEGDNEDTDRVPRSGVRVTLDAGWASAGNHR